MLTEDKIERKPFLASPYCLFPIIDDSLTFFHTESLLVLL